MNKLPFDPYDFFGYLASGLLILVGMDLVFGFPHILGRDFKLVDSAILVIAVYVTGQIIATPAKAFLEDGLVGKVLGRPNVNLFQEKKPRIRGLIFPGFYLALPTRTRVKILNKAKNEGVEGTGEDLFLHVRYNQAVIHDQKLGEKLNSFINKYGFSRNLSFSVLLVGIGCLMKMFLFGNSNTDLAKYAFAAIITAVLLFYRYLKFYRQYSYEMFNFYGGLK
jgi:multisubunit Na+/H+ antiporter MnhB subunit